MQREPWSEFSGVAGRLLTGSISGGSLISGVVLGLGLLAVDWALHGITVNAICPGIFLTEPNQVWSKKHPEIIEEVVRNIPMGTLGNPEDLGPLAVYLSSDGARYMTRSSLSWK